jgi:Fic family protein
MNYLKVEAIIEIDESMFPLKDKDDIKWFLEMMNDTENTSLQVWSNDIGDEVCKTNSFKWTILTELK